MTQTTEFIDLSDHDAFLDGVPHEAFAALRREDPVHWNPEPDGRGFWAVTRYDDIRTVHRTPEVFSSEIGGTSLEDLEPEHIEARKSMIDTDPPRHDELRALVNRRFTPRAVTVWEDQVRKVAGEVLDLALPKGEFDFVREIASEIPMQVFAEILGVPAVRAARDHRDRRPPARQRRPRVRRAPTTTRTATCRSRARPRWTCSPSAAALADERREHPRDDIMTALVQAGLTQREMDVYFVLLATAGNETTRHTISHGLIALLEHPEEMERLRQDPSLGKTATEEMLRWATPVHHFRRTAAVDTELGGTEIRAGDKVTTWFVSGNRDETVFEEPDRFDIARTPNPHMTFGPGGVHHCLGAHLAKMEIRDHLRGAARARGARSS